MVREIGESTLRELLVYDYRMLYRVREDRVVIRAFLHGTRDFSKWRREQDPGTLSTLTAAAPVGGPLGEQADSKPLCAATAGEPNSVRPFIQSRRRKIYPVALWIGHLRGPERCFYTAASK